MNVAAMIQRFESDEVAGARVRIDHPGGPVTVTTDEEGFFEAWIHPRPEFAPGALWHTLELRAGAARVRSPRHAARRSC